MQGKFVIEGLNGKRTLEGTLPVHGAKNAALKVFAATMLFKDPVALTNVPNIEDIKRMVELLRDVGAGVVRTSPHTYLVTPPTMPNHHPSHEIFRRIRASIVLIGPLLARCGEVSFVFPGGCTIGRRPLNIFFEGFEKMGATLTTVESESSTEFTLSGKLKGAELFLKMPSVTATETLLLAATLARGTTVIKNAAMEPEILSLADFLNACGAKIAGAGTPTLVIKGRNGKLLAAQGRTYHTPPDRIETGSFLLLAALAGKDVTITQCNPKQCEALLSLLETSGVQMKVEKSSVRVTNADDQPFRAFNVKTHEYPGFPTDLQPLIVLFLTQAEGGSSVLETIYESRHEYIESLNKMGARIRANNNEILIVGPNALTGIEMEGRDLRSGMAFIMAGILAQGTSVVQNAYNVDRGYERIETRLGHIGVSITRLAA